MAQRLIIEEDYFEVEKMFQSAKNLPIYTKMDGLFPQQQNSLRFLQSMVSYQKLKFLQGTDLLVQVPMYQLAEPKRLNKSPIIKSFFINRYQKELFGKFGISKANSFDLNISFKHNINLDRHLNLLLFMFPKLPGMKMVAQDETFCYEYNKVSFQVVNSDDFCWVGN